MVERSHLQHLLEQVQWQAQLSYIEGLEPFRRLLDTPDADRVLAFLESAYPTLQEHRRAGVAFILANAYREQGELEKLQTLAASEDGQPLAKTSVLEACCSQPRDAAMGRMIVDMAIAAAGHPDPKVRTAAASTIQNQAAWKIDVQDAQPALESLLRDADSRVQQQAALAVGNLAKQKYDVSQCLPSLRANARNRDFYARDAAAWALWQMSRSKHDIGAAVDQLAQILADDDDYDQAQKNAAGALLHHARKSMEHARQVQSALARVRLDPQRKAIQRLLSQLPSGAD